MFDTSGSLSWPNRLGHLRESIRPTQNMLRSSALYAVAIWLCPTLVHSQCAFTLECSLNLTFNDGQGHAMPYRLFLPPGYNEPGAEFPLILFLHGSGERGSNNLSQVQVHINALIAATQSEDYQAFLLAPQLPSGSTFWNPNEPYDLTPEILDDVTSSYAVDTSRLYITGLSLGGYGTVDYVHSFPSKFAAAVPMSGAPGEIPPTDAALIKDVPFWLFHGNQDTTVLPEESRDFVASLQAVGERPRHLGAYLQRLADVALRALSMAVRAVNRSGTHRVSTNGSMRRAFPILPPPSPLVTVVSTSRGSPEISTGGDDRIKSVCRGVGRR